MAAACRGLYGSRGLTGAVAVRDVCDRWIRLIGFWFEIERSGRISMRPDLSFEAGRILCRPQQAAVLQDICRLQHAAAVRDVCRAAASRGLIRCFGQGRIRGEVVMPREAGYSPVFDCMTTSPAFSFHARNPAQNIPYRSQRAACGMWRFGAPIDETGPCK